MTTALTVNLLQFVRHLRARGLRVGPLAVEELTAAVDAVGLTHRADVKSAFAAIVIARPTERQVFDEAFERFFGKGLLRFDAEPEPGGEPETVTLETEHLSVPLLAESGEVGDVLDEIEIPEVVGASAEERLERRDFRDLTPEESEEVRRIMSHIVWRPAEADSRRWVAGPAGSRPDMRRTMRKLVGPSGDLMQLALAERKPRRRPLVVRTRRP